MKTADAIAAYNLGRAALFHMHFGGTESIVAVIYGWTGSDGPTILADRSDDLVKAVVLELDN